MQPLPLFKSSSNSTRGVADETAGIADRFEERIRDGFQYGDYQFATDSTRDSFLRRGVFSCYQLVPLETPLTEHPTRFNPEDCARLTFYSGSCQPPTSTTTMRT